MLLCIAFLYTFLSLIDRYIALYLTHVLLACNMHIFYISQDIKHFPDYVSFDDQTVLCRIL